MIAFDDRDGWIWFDGDFVPWREAKLHLLSHGLHYGSGVFEGERCYDGTIFASEEHSRRLHFSAGLMGMKLPVSVAEIEKIKSDTLEKQGFENAYVRAFAWRGAQMMGISAQKNEIHFAVAAWSWGDYFADKMKGIRMEMARWRRPGPDCAPGRAKATGLYIICTLSKHEAESRGYQDALMLDYKGRVSEATGAHIVLIRNGELHTPKTDIILDGITRKYVIKIARQRGYQVTERDIYPDELGNFSECFIVGTAAEVTPVSSIAPHQYQPGTITQAIMEDYAQLTLGKLALEAI